MTPRAGVGFWWLVVQMVLAASTRPAARSSVESSILAGMPKSPFRGASSGEAARTDLGCQRLVDLRNLKTVASLNLTKCQACFDAVQQAKVQQAKVADANKRAAIAQAKAEQANTPRSAAPG